MKLLAVFVASVLCSVNTTPTVPRDNSHYIDGESRYIWMPAHDGELTLVDLQMADTRDLLEDGENQYWLYSRENPTEYQLLVNGDLDSVKNSNFRIDRPTNVLVHGWTNSATSRDNVYQRDALLEALDSNIIVVDWRIVAGRLYPAAVLGVPKVGEDLGAFLDWLITSTGGDWNNVHLFGFSLGAHVVGNAGRAVGGKVARVTGLDPAGPLWRVNNNRLNTESGQYVEIIHTDGGVQGYLSPIGHVDFYPNGGSSQPGCSDMHCNHDRSYQLFASSALTEHLVGKKCRNFVQAVSVRCSGEELKLGTTDMKKRGNGIYGLKTQAAFPY